MVRTDLPGAQWIEPLLLIPIFVSPMVLAFGYVVSAGPVGFYAVWAKQLFGAVPWNVYSLDEHHRHRGPDARAARLPLRLVRPEEPRLRRRGSGADGRRSRRSRSRRDVSLPMIMPALLFSGVLVFFLGFEIFGLPLVLGDPRATSCSRPICTSSPTSSARRPTT